MKVKVSFNDEKTVVYKTGASAFNIIAFHMKSFLSKPSMTLKDIDPIRGKVVKKYVEVDTTYTGETIIIAPRKLATAVHEFLKGVINAKFVASADVVHYFDTRWKAIGVDEKAFRELLVSPDAAPVDPSNIEDVFKRAWKEARPYQIDTILRAIRTLISDTGVTIQAPTGAGKTEMALAMLRFLLDTQVFKKAYVVVHQKQLVVQFAERAKAFGFTTYVRHGEGEVGNLHEAELAAFTPSKFNIDDATDAILIVDEAHHTPAATIKKVIAKFTEKGGLYTVGLTATAWRTDGLNGSLFSTLGSPIESISARYLIENEYLSKPKIIVSRVKVDPLELARDLGVPIIDNFDEIPRIDYYVYLAPWVDLLDVKEAFIKMMVKEKKMNPRSAGAKFMNEFEKWFTVKNADKIAKKIAKYLIPPAVVLVKKVEAAKAIARELNKLGFKAAAIDGRTKVTIRSEIIRKLEQGDLDVVVATPLFDEGIDIPSIKSLFVVSGGKSSIKAVQRVGRALRRTHDKKEVLIVDIGPKGIYEDHQSSRVYTVKEYFGIDDVEYEND